ncbi:HNH endonuclease [Vibrio vulnificus]|nr:HNH endonuclease [Vibrio vulnificus]EJD0676821.1 HNH endonuclease [Vibrio vulnificus]EJZ7973253.1 HNH endonuclease [Vibrio vulnificus]
MIRNPIVFTQEQLDIISVIKSGNDFNSESWMCDKVDVLRPVIRQHYATEQNSICPYCKMQLNTQRGRVWDVEHVIPRSTVENFMFEPLNLCVACVECNSAKSNKQVTTSKAKVRYPRTGYNIIHPHFDDYQAHISIIRIGLFYFPKTEKGEKTIYTCELNRFYSYADFDDNLNDLDDMIVVLANSLRETENEKTKAYLRGEIRELTLRQALLG